MLLKERIKRYQPKFSLKHLLVILSACEVLAGDWG